MKKLRRERLGNEENCFRVITKRDVKTKIEIPTKKVALFDRKGDKIKSTSTALVLVKRRPGSLRLDKEEIFAVNRIERIYMLATA